jgi:hypothetical protein
MLPVLPMLPVTSVASVTNVTSVTSVTNVASVTSVTSVASVHVYANESEVFSSDVQVKSVRLGTSDVANSRPKVFVTAALTGSREKN